LCGHAYIRGRSKRRSGITAFHLAAEIALPYGRVSRCRHFSTSLCISKLHGGQCWTPKEVNIRSRDTPYNRDPDGFAAEHFGLTKPEYRDWVIQEGHALCGTRTKAGKPCRNFVTRHGSEPAEWKAANRKDVCGSHGFWS
jgi:hypothetical protein